MSDSNKSANSGIGFTGLLTILFISPVMWLGGLKLTGVISWSWWWVLSPLWISFALFLCVVVIAMVVVVVSLRR